MATSPIISYSNLDFDVIKQDLLDYIGTIGSFTDYNQKGSNLNTLVQIVAYINNILAYNLNQAVNEGWLSTASLRENVLKAVKILNYLPTRAQSSNILVDLTAMTTTGSPVYLLKYDKIRSGALKFYYTGVPIEKTGSTIQASFSEGTLVTSESAYTGLDVDFESFIIPNVTIGNYLKIYTTAGGIRTYWEAFEPGTIYSSPATHMLYFIEEVSNGYKISFGNNNLGRRPVLGEVIGYDFIQPSVDLSTNQQLAFTWEGNGYLETLNLAYTGGRITGATVTPATGWEGGSLGGAVKETMTEIKFNAPKFFQSQGRAVTEGDFLALAVKHPLISNAVAIGGDSLTPLELGKVYIVAKPDLNNYPYPEFTQPTLDLLKEYFKKYKVVTIDPVVQNPQYVYLTFNSLLRYTVDSRIPSLSTTRTAIQDFINVSNAEFGDYLEFSKLSKVIDEADVATSSNITSLHLYLHLLQAQLQQDNTTLKVKLPKRIYDTTQTASTKKTYIEEVNGSNVVVKTYYEDVDYSIAYTYNNYATISNFISTHTGGPAWGTYTYKLYVYSEDSDVFLSEMQLFRVETNEISLTLEKV